MGAKRGQKGAQRDHKELKAIKFINFCVVVKICMDRPMMASVVGAKRDEKGAQMDHQATKRAHEGCLGELKGAKRQHKGTKRTDEECLWE